MRSSDNTVCSACRSRSISKGRAVDRRRCYRCESCGAVWTDGMQGARRRYSPQRQSYQFHDTGASRVRI